MALKCHVHVLRAIIHVVTDLPPQVADRISGSYIPHDRFAATGAGEHVHHVIIAPLLFLCHT